VVSQVLRLIEDQLSKCAQKIDALLLVGGFSGSAYLFTKVDVSRAQLQFTVACMADVDGWLQEQFRNRIGVIARPADADTATCRGAARYGLANRQLVSSVITPRAYMMGVRFDISSVRS
jgi:hypothetical protein